MIVQAPYSPYNRAELAVRLGTLHDGGCVVGDQERVRVIALASRTSR
eukprot:COSAG01_NODE_33580_length_561_cov_2079.716450_1_plen_46_part_10